MGLIYSIGDSASGLYRPPANASSAARNESNNTSTSATTTNSVGDKTTKETSSSDKSTDKVKEEPESDAGKSKTEENRNVQADQRALAELKARDRDVRAHEAAHKAAGGSLTGPASFSYEVGADGKRYAVGGEVSIDTSPVSGDPHATVIKANRVRAAALAPANPSAQDQSVAASASAMAAEARVDIIKEQQQAAEDIKSSDQTVNSDTTDSELTKTESTGIETKDAQIAKSKEQETSPLALVVAERPTPESQKGKVVDTFV